MRTLSNTEAELKKSAAYKKGCICVDQIFKIVCRNYFKINGSRDI